VTTKSRRLISSEKLELIRLATEDKWPIYEIIETYRVSHQTIMKYFPDYKPLTFAEAGSFSPVKRRAKRMGINL